VHCENGRAHPFTVMRTGKPPAGAAKCPSSGKTGFLLSELTPYCAFSPPPLSFSLSLTISVALFIAFPSPTPSLTRLRRECCSLGWWDQAGR